MTHVVAMFVETVTLGAKALYGHNLKRETYAVTFKDVRADRPEKASAGMVMMALELTSLTT